MNLPLLKNLTALALVAGSGVTADAGSGMHPPGSKKKSASRLRGSERVRGFDVVF